MPDIRLQDYTEKIKGMIRDVRLDDAIHHCRHILSHYPKHVATYSLLGEACLEKELYREAIEFFQRTLSADPENLIARVGLGVIYDEQGALPEAIWQLERGFELAPGNAEVRRELQRLYALHEGSEKTRLRLTRGALGRLYVRNGLYERAISEFHAVLRQDPDLPDIHVALAEALWQGGRKLDAVEVCMDILETLPNCLKANLILGELWMRGGNEEAGEEKLNVARELDPENLVAQEMMESESPLPLEEVLIPELLAVPDTFEPIGLAEVGVAAAAAWDLVGETEAPSEEVALPEAAEAWDEDEALPDWLRDVTVVDEGEPVPELEAEEEVPAVAQPEEGIPSDQVPEWLEELMDEGAPTAAEEVLVDEEAPSPEEEPEWLSRLEEAEFEEPAAPTDAEAPPDVEAPVEEAALAAAVMVSAGVLGEDDLHVDDMPDDEIPEWLQEFVGEQVPGVEEIALPPTAEMAEAETPFVEEAPPVEEAADIEDVGPPPVVEVVEEEVPPVAEEAVLARSVPPSLLALVEAGLLDEADVESAMVEMSAEELEAQQAEEVPGWLEDLVEEEQAPFAVQPLVEEALVIEEETFPTEEVPGPEAPSFEEVPEWVKGLAEPVEEEVVPAEEAPSIEGLPDWVRDLAEQAAVEEEVALVEEVPPVSEVPVEEVPPIEEVPLPVVEAPVEEVPPVDEVPAWIGALAEPVEEVSLPVVEPQVEEKARVEEAPLPIVEAPVEEKPPVEEAPLPIVEAPVEEKPPVEEVPLPIVEAPVEEKPSVEEVAFAVVEPPLEEVPAPSREDELLEQLEARPRDHNARLELARLYAGEQDWDAALAQYEKLASVRKLQPDVRQDLESLLEQDVDKTRLYAVLGDIYMQQDQLDEALEMYRLARRSLTNR